MYTHQGRSRNSDGTEKKPYEFGIDLEDQPALETVLKNVRQDNKTFFANLELQKEQGNME